MRTGTVENVDSLIFSPQGRILLLQPLSELHIWDKIKIEDVPDGAFIFGETGIDSLDTLPAKIIFHNCNDYFSAGEWTNPETGETQLGVIHFAKGYGDTGDLETSEGNIEIVFDCETLSVPTATLKDEDYYPFDCVIYDISGKVLYQGKFGDAFYNRRILNRLQEMLLFVRIVFYDGSQVILKKIYKY